MEGIYETFDTRAVMFNLLKTRVDDCLRNDLDIDNVLESIFNAYFEGELTSSQYDSLLSKIS